MITLATTEREYPWGTLRSTNASKVKVILEEKNLSYRVDRLHPKDLWAKPETILSRHPLGKVPYIEIGDDCLFDSTVINEYLDDEYPDPPLKPRNARDLARMRMLENFGDEAVLVGDLPKVWMPMWSGPEKRDLEAMEKGRQGLRQTAFAYLETQVTEGEYLCGEFSLADAPYMAMAMVLEVDGMNLTDFPRLAAYLERLRSRDSYRSISPHTSLADSEGKS